MTRLEQSTFKLGLLQISVLPDTHTIAFFGPDSSSARSWDISTRAVRFAAPRGLVTLPRPAHGNQARPCFHRRGSASVAELRIEFDKEPVPIASFTRALALRSMGYSGRSHRSARYFRIAELSVRREISILEYCDAAIRGLSGFQKAHR